ncbi:hypothetical protein CLV30_101148 [Haloactinopolyspora alba]|uniref:Uncharacterized protein n=1 Tax=Haloactinopolyspora alba TaxID=648780 RepID=A0A2P8EFG1_9ACTN|nr:hypothetical protein [Haloactinopolyspora alba]PSL08181.1 hypothetical protein CLV30_101148 [Haloactinopolyspora alba]
MNGVRQRWTEQSGTAKWGVGAGAAALLVVLVLGWLSDGPTAGSPTGDDAPGKAARTSGAPTGPDPTPAPSRSSSPEPSATTGPGSRLKRPADTSSPEEYAASIARIVLGTNPRDHARDDYLAVLLGEVTDEAVGESRDRVEPVITSALPDEYQWLRQRDHGQVNTFTVEHVWEPDAVDGARDEIPDGYAVRTVAGTQTTRFVGENGKPATSSTPRLITVIAYCPDGGTCALVSIPQEVIR